MLINIIHSFISVIFKIIFNSEIHKLLIKRRIELKIQIQIVEYHPNPTNPMRASLLLKSDPKLLSRVAIA
jgi:hypothetical protein